MPILPDPSAQNRPAPRFGGPVSVPESDAVEASVSRLGESIAGFGEVLVKAQIRDDKYQVEDATTKLQQSMLDLSKGDDGFTKIKSGDVAGNNKFYEEQLGRFESARKDIENSLPSDEQKAMFARRGEVAKIGYSENLINHITKEKEAFNGQVYKGGIATEMDLASSDYDNPSEVARALHRTERLTEAESDRQGLKGDVRKILLKQNKSAIHESVIRQAVDDGNHAYAKGWFEKNQKDILGESQDEIKSLLRDSGIRGASQESVDDYVYRGLNETQARAEARKIKDPGERDATLARIGARYGEAAQILDENQKAAGEEAWEIFAETGDIDSVPLSTLREMDGKERAAIQSTAAIAAAGAEVKTDFGTYYGLRQMATEDPAAFKNENLLKYAHLLSPADRKEMVKLQTDDKGIAIARTQSQALNQGAVAAGFMPKEATKSGPDGDNVRAYYRRADEEVQAFQLATGKVPTPKDISEIADRLAIEVIRDPNAWFFTGERPAVSAEIEGVPADMIDELAAAVQRARQPVTDENIKTLYRALR